MASDRRAVGTSERELLTRIRYEIHLSVNREQREERGRMTRETTIGLVVSCSFLCLVGVVIVTKMRPGTGPTPHPDTLAEERAAHHQADRGFTGHSSSLLSQFSVHGQM